ncbi:NGL2 [Candida pseudojiufengensis]|uniref:NGL2 n=1 Tax=Candida pseudojiufengensis TaxID=497109 RepID=UPI0022247CCB|nr:NGL2 [Candida pseudojiufengensis]KAI5963128.1 NGL2 [Candida pseudojiufengensis]
MTKKKGTKKPMDPSKITPEYIEKQRRLRNERKENERKEKEARGVFDSPGPIEKFIKRPFLEVEPLDDSKFNIAIMSYNMLAQCLIRRDLYPTNGKILKWSVRSKILHEEINWYNPTILCLQECDKFQYYHFWQEELKKLGYDSKFYRYNTKNHGLVIAFKLNYFTCKYQSFIKYDNHINYLPDEVRLPDARIITKNVGFMCFLEFKPELLNKYSYLSNKHGIIIGTTHLFWHPFGTYERCLQTYMILHKLKEFQHTLSILLKTNNEFYSFFTGDFNSEPFDAPYLSMVNKPVVYEGSVKNALGCSLSYTFSKERSLDDEDEEEEVEKDEDKMQEEDDSDNDDESGQEDESKVLDQREIERQNNPKNPEPDVFIPTKESEEIMSQLENAHNDLNVIAISLYSVGYKIVDPKNALNTNNEPSFSNWVDKWNGMLDYIMIIIPWDKNEFNKPLNSDSPQKLSKYGIKLTKLLKLPTPEEMGAKPNGQPRMNQYPSDHLCIMCQVELL